MDNHDLTLIRAARTTLTTEAAALLTEYQDTKHRATLIMASIFTAASSVVDSLLKEYEAYSAGKMPNQVPTVVAGDDIIRIHDRRGGNGDAA